AFRTITGIHNPPIMSRPAALGMLTSMLDLTRIWLKPPSSRTDCLRSRTAGLSGAGTGRSPGRDEDRLQLEPEDRSPLMNTYRAFLAVITGSALLGAVSWQVSPA